MMTSANDEKNRAVRFKIFRGAGSLPWDSLFEDAARFASAIGRERIINISHSSDSGSGTVVVWYQEIST